MRGLLREFLELALPSACAGCGRAPGAADRILCPACDSQLPRLESPRDPRPPLPVRASVAAVSFEDVAEDWIHRFKYPEPGLAGLAPGPEAVVRMLAREASSHLPSPVDAVVAVPQHPHSLRRRGFWPAGKLAAEVSRSLGCRFERKALLRVRDTPSQTGLNRRERGLNVARAFEASGPLAARIALVDDVTTTGATLAECARVLGRAGAREVAAVCAARRL